MKRSSRILCCDFETTVYAGQTSTEVWASAVVEMGTEDVKIFHSISETFGYFKSLNCDIIAYYHNLKFDGEFWMYYLVSVLKFKVSVTNKDENGQVLMNELNEMKNNTFICSISSMGQWYTLTMKVNNHIIQLRDSLKLLPFNLRKIGDSFKTKHRKLEMEYTGYRYAGCVITDKEKEYIRNDVLVLKEALEICYAEGHNKLTIGSCCLYEFMKTYSKEEYELLFPKLDQIVIDSDLYAYENADKYIRKSYKGGWCYLVRGKENQIKENGTTADVNSLYPSMMSSESGNIFPYGRPTFWKGNYIPSEAVIEGRYYFVRIKTRFYLKKNKLPFIQIKGNCLYKGTESLETSDIWDKENKCYCAKWVDDFGEVHDTRVVLTLTMTDYILFLEHYQVVDFEILDGCWFNAVSGLFDLYIHKYKEIKQNSKGAIRELAKLFLNNLYGKLASSDDSSFKVPYLRDDDVIGYDIVMAHEKQTGFIACGSAITSYARNFTIRAAQQNYYGADQKGFIYADTDSIHCDLKPEEIKGIKVHETNFCCWKLESCWDVGIFVRQKTYIEHVVAENLEPIEEPFYNVKCAGMPDSCKKLFLLSMQGYQPKTQEEKDKFDAYQLEFLEKKRTLKDYKKGLVIPGKLVPRRIKGGVLLVGTTYEMR